MEKEAIVKLLKKPLKELKIKIKDEEIQSLIEIPPSAEMGDYAFPCFSFSSQLKKNPHEIALEIRENIGNAPPTDFDDVQVKGAYLNFFVDRKNLARKVIWESINQGKNYGRSKKGKGKKIIVEFSSPNIAKPFGIGHLRSTIIGNAISNIAEFQGYKVIRMNYLGDWGTGFGKLIYGYEKWGNEKKLQKDPIKHLLELYVKVSKNKNYEKNAREAFKELENGNKKAQMLWKLFRTFSLKEFEKLYNEMGIKFDVLSGESFHNKERDKILKLLESKNLVKKSKGALIIDLTKYNLGVALIQKSDGTTLYATRDLAAAISRHKKYNFDSMIYEVGQEQKLYFQQLFKILELLGYKWAKNCIHVYHGLYLDKDGKKFATRKGKTIFMEDIIDKTKEIARKQIKKKAPSISKSELEKRTNIVALGSIFYGDLKNNRTNDMIFDLNKFVSFEGNTGPYLQYSYARASSILKKAGATKKFEILELEQKEIELSKKLSEFSDVVETAYTSLNPSLIANYSYQLCQIFNEFYHSCPVIGSSSESFRLALVQSFRQVLQNALNLLRINVLEEM